MNHYSENEIAEQEAHKDMLDTILGSNTQEPTVIERLQLYAALKENEHAAVEVEKYHLADIYNEVAEDVFA